MGICHLRRNQRGPQVQAQRLAERLCSLFAKTGPNNRTCYPPHAFPVSREGSVCVVVNKAIVADDPMAILMDFARDNDLKVVGGGKVPRD